MDDFLKFWAVYPRKEGKGKAFDTWGKLKSKGILPPVEIIVKAIQDRTKANAWPEKPYIKHPSTWLNAWGWEDEFLVTQPWYETWDGIVEKGAEYGLYEKNFSHPQLFKQAVMERAEGKVIQLRQA